MTFTQIIQLISATGGLLAALSASAALVLGLRNATKIGEVHEAVNSTSAAQNARVDQLTDSLTTASVPVPERPSPQDDATEGKAATP